jgi:hypothetical protein
MFPLHKKSLKENSLKKQQSEIKAKQSKEIKVACRCSRCRVMYGKNKIPLRKSK